MAKIEKFEDIEAWKLAREVTQLVYEVSSDVILLVTTR